MGIYPYRDSLFITTNSFTFSSFSVLRDVSNSDFSLILFKTFMNRIRGWAVRFYWWLSLLESPSRGYMRLQSYCSGEDSNWNEELEGAECGQWAGGRITGRPALHPYSLRSRTCNPSLSHALTKHQDDRNEEINCHCCR